MLHPRKRRRCRRTPTQLLNKRMCRTAAGSEERTPRRFGGGCSTPESAVAAGALQHNHWTCACVWLRREVRNERHAALAEDAPPPKAPSQPAHSNTVTGQATVCTEDACLLLTGQ